MASFVGYKVKNVPINGRSDLGTIELEPQAISGEELVVIGYGVQRKKDLTGSISHLDMPTAEMTATTDLTQVLQGATPGLNAKSGSRAGETGGLSIRGKTSLSASDRPLLVVDGMIFNGSTADLNINDIASVDVLKGASAAAVYGSRSANGVIVITTKQGQTEKPQFNFNAYYGVQELANTDRDNVMNGEQYATRLVDYYYQQDLYDWYKTNPTSAGGRPQRPDITDRDLVASYLRTEEEQGNYLAGNQINWMDQIFRIAPIQSYTLSVSGQTDKTNYYLSTSYTNQEGILVNDKFERLTLFSKFENELTDWFTIEFDPMFTLRDYSGLEASISDALIASPYGDKYNDSGEYPVYIAGESYAYHPLGHQLVDDSQPQNNLNFVLKGKIDVPRVEGLRYQVDFSKNYIFNRHYQYFPKSVAEGSKVDGQAIKNTSNQSKWLINNTITYNRTFKNLHKINVTLLHSDEKLTGEGTLAQGVGFNSEKLGYHSLELAETQEISSSSYREYTRSFLGRVNYIFKDRYLFTATIRRDGYSGFGSNRKWGNFPSLSAGWVISDEPFLNEPDWLNFLKLRLSYGVNGNQGIGRYRSLSHMESISTVFEGATAIGLYSSSMGNDDLGWEKTTSANFGVDFRLLSDRLIGSVDYYEASTSDVLVARAIPRVSGNSSVYDNIGGIENKGIEVSLDTYNIDKLDFSWKTSFTFALNRNKITKLYGDVTEDIGNTWFVGHSIYSVYGYEIEGVWQEEDLFEGRIPEGYYPGQFKMKDLNGDGEITADADRKILGSTDPNYRFSIGNEFNYKNFSLHIFINSIQGRGGYYIGSNSGALIAGGTDQAYRLNRTAIRDYWRPNNPVNNAPGMYYDSKITPSVYQDKSFIRLQDVTLSYSFSQESLAKLGLTNLRIYASGKNLYTWTKWSGWDPDVQNPLMRSVIGGVKLGF